MKWIVMLLIFAGGTYYLVNRHKAELRQQELVEQMKKELIKKAEAAALPLNPERIYPTQFSPATLETLRTLTQDVSDKVRYASMDVLWQVQDERVADIINEMFANETESKVKIRIIKLLAKDRSKLSLALLSNAVNNYDKETRLNAVEAIGTFSSQEAIVALTPTMKDYDEEIRFKAIEAVNRIRKDIQAEKERQIKAMESKTSTFKVD